MVRTKKASYSDGEDRISRLPDSLIHHIMSFNDTKYAVQTCVLSKRWIDVWKSLPFLKFNRSSFAKKKKHSFITFVDMVFICREDVDVQKLSVRWEKSAYDKLVAINVNKWSLHAVKYNVEEISIVVEQLYNSAYGIPPRLLNCKSLRKLVIKVSDTKMFVDILLPISMNLPHLKELSLCGFMICNLELSKRLFSSCPVLETLSISECALRTDKQRNLIVDSVSLKEFVFSLYRLPLNDTVTSIIKLCAPNLKEIDCRSFLIQDFSLENSSPLSGVTFNMCLEDKEKDWENAYSKMPLEEKKAYAKRMVKFLGAVHMVNDMRLSPGFLEVLSQAPDLLDCPSPLLCKLQSLVLEMWCTRGCLRGIAYLLSISPDVDTIYLDSKQSNLADVGDDWEAGLPLPGMLSHLEYVEVEEVEGCDAEFKILRFLFKNAMILKNVILDFRSCVGSPDRLRQIEQFKDKLRAVPTASSSIELVFN